MSAIMLSFKTPASRSRYFNRLFTIVCRHRHAAVRSLVNQQILLAGLLKEQHDSMGSWVSWKQDDKNVSVLRGCLTTARLVSRLAKLCWYS